MMDDIEHRVSLAERAERIATYAYKSPNRAALVEYVRLEIGSAVIEADVNCQESMEENVRLKGQVATWERRFDAWQNWRVFEDGDVSPISEGQ